MTRDTSDPPDSDDRLGAILAAGIEAVDNGAADAEMVVARYPEYAAELREFFAAQERTKRLVAPLQSMLQAAQTVKTADAVSALPSLLGDFRLLREVGRGGMGIVYEAEQVSLGRRVALKMLPTAAAVNPLGLHRFQNEARAAASLHHTNIVPVYAVGSEGGIPFYAMQFINGQTLAAILVQLRRRHSTGSDDAGEASRDQPAPNDTPGGLAVASEPSTAQAGLLSTEGGLRGREYYRAVARLGVQAAEALDCAHQFGVVHRDIKPANLMVEAGGHLWVTDFGLARVLADASLTATGDVVGTLRYMSPEQALAKRGVIDHRADVYSLGATLYELLTLKPAFPGRDREEVLLQIAFNEPLRPRRLNSAVPLELEVVVLKALEKSPADRYATAQELADDLRRWLDDRPILAQRPSWARLATRWARRHKPLVGATLAVLLVAVVLGGGTWLWWAQKRVGAESVARAALQESAGLLDEERWPEALSAARRAESVLAGVGADAGLCRQARGVIEDLEMARRLQEARLQAAADTKNGYFDSVVADAAYSAAFKDYGLDVDGPDTQAAAEQIRARSIKRQLVAALDEWALVRRALLVEGWRQRLAVARAVDPDLGRNRLRDFMEAKQLTSLEELVAADAANDWPLTTVQLLGSLARRTASSGERVAAVLGQAQQRHPDDFWINETLGLLLSQARPPHQEEALRFKSVAVALRPQSPGARINLATSLRDMGRLDEASTAYREAIRLKPDYVEAHNSLGYALAKMGRLEEGIAEFRLAIGFKPDLADAHAKLAEILAEKGRSEEAIPEFREAIRLKPGHAGNHNNLGTVLYAKEQLEEAIDEFSAAVRLNEKQPLFHCNLGAALAEKGRLQEAGVEFRKAIALKPDSVQAHASLGKLLIDQGIFQEAETVCRKAIALKPDDPQSHYDLGRALGAKNQLDEAIAQYREALRLREAFPEAHCNLGQLLGRKGQFKQAVVELRRGHELGSSEPGWNHPSARWLREAELLVQNVDSLQPVLQGKSKPKNPSECFAFAKICQKYRQEHAAAARFYAEGIARQPAAADDLQLAYRYDAACVAALAGCGQGKDANTIDTKARVAFRKQALDWLRADLKAHRQLLDNSASKAGPGIQHKMQHWLQDTDFTGVRGPDALARLPEAERGDWQKLWEEVEALRQRAATPTQPTSPARP